MKVWDEGDIRSAVSLAEARDAVRRAFVAMESGGVIAPDEMAMKLDHGGELHVKGAYLGGSSISFKVATGQFPNAPNSGFTVVLDASSGAEVAILDDGGWLTEVRTAAASAISALALARPESTRLGLLGAGAQAEFQIKAMRDALPIDRCAVWSRSFENARRFGEANDAVAVSDVEEAVADADIVVCCTPSTSPLLSYEMLLAGTHVIAVGSDMAGKRELASSVVESCNLYACDSIVAASRFGELQHVPDAIGNAIELGAILAGNHPGRTTDQQVTVTDLCGLGIQDAAMADLVVSKLTT